MTMTLSKWLVNEWETNESAITSPPEAEGDQRGIVLFVVP